MDFIGCSQLAARLSTIAVDSVEALASECYRVPSSRRHSIYKLARDIPILQRAAPEEDYATQLQRALNQASATNAALMDYSPSASRVDRRVLRKRSTVSVSPTKSAPPKPRTSASSSPTVPKKRGRPLGSKNTPNTKLKLKPTPKVVQSEAHKEEEEEEEEEEHRPADVMEPHFPSIGVDIGGLPPPSEALLFVTFRGLFLAQRDRDARLATPPTSLKKVVAPITESAPRPPVPRRSLFRRSAHRNRR